SSDNITKGCPTPPSDSSKPKSALCAQVGFSGPTYTGPDGCPASCPTTTTSSDNIPKGCPTPSSSSTSTTQNVQPNQGQQQQQQPGSNCNTNLMIGCGSINPSNTTTTPNQSPPPQTNTPGTTNAGGSTGSNSFSPNQPFTTLNPNTNIGRGTTNQLVNPNAFNYQINPATPSVDISKDPTQKINSQVTNSFGQGVPDIPVSIQVKDPTGNTAALFTGKTDNDGKNVVSFPVKTAGTWTAIVTISSSPAAGGPFGDQITWNAVSGMNLNSSNLTALVNLPRTTVVLSDDPREQILTTVKDPAGNGVKDIALRIKITDPDAVSKTFSRITDANGVDQFIIPVDKAGKWVATLTLIDPTNGKTVPITSVGWNAIP
ncbi:MAG: hypothetical protein ACTHKC_10745, partial [Candidatus Nitrosocosmicus sp.]